LPTENPSNLESIQKGKWTIIYDSSFWLLCYFICQTNVLISVTLKHSQIDSTNIIYIAHYIKMLFHHAEGTLECVHFWKHKKISISSVWHTSVHPGNRQSLISVWKISICNTIYINIVTICMHTTYIHPYRCNLWPIQLLYLVLLKLTLGNGSM
jgi:hypothetical protein